jgi:signal transduction histidine kinase
LSLLFSLSIINEIVQWIAAPAAIVYFTWEMVPLFQIAVTLSAGYFIYVFAKQKDLSFKLKLPFALLALPVIVLTPTVFNYSAFDLENCEAINGLLWQYIYIFNIIVGVSILFFLYQQLRLAHKNAERHGQMWMLALGSFIFLGAFIAANVIGDATRIYEINLFGPIGMAAFITTMSFIIVRYKAFNFRIIGAQALVMALLIITISILFIRNIENIRYVLVPSILLIGTMGIILIRGVKREVEQREKLEVLSNELKAANDRLEILDQQKTQFVSFASHDLKSPINIIKQFASLIADGTYKEPAKVAETVLKIKSTADRATQMVDDFLDIRKLEEGQMDYNFEKKDIVSFLKGICEDYAPVAKAQKNIVISFIPATSKSPAGSILINMDSTRLRQVFQNYLNNSVKYSNANKPGENKSWIKVMVTEEQSTVLITIKDSGMGINPEILPTLFEQFHRDKKTVKKIQGTGLGLYISKQIVHGHGGETWAESEGVDKGSIFYVRLKKA